MTLKDLPLVDQTPLMVCDVELSLPLVELPPPSMGSGRARLLVRLHGHPLGFLDLILPRSGLEPAALGLRIWQDFSSQITRHVIEDGGQSIDGIPLEGFGAVGQAFCSWRARVPKPPAAAVVINTCGGRAHLVAAIASALEQDYPNYEVVVVDNRPATSGVRALLEEKFAAQDRIRYVSEFRAGLGRARNAGIRATKADIIAFTDDDVVLDKSWLSWLVAGFGAGDRVACVTGLVVALELETRAQLLFDDFVGWSKRLEGRVWDRDEHRLDHPLYPYTVGLFGTGANGAFRREVLTGLGGFDPHLGVGTPACGGEDLDIYATVILSGYQLVFEPAAIVRHVHPREMDQLTRRTLTYGVGLSAMLTKHFLQGAQTRRELLRRLPAGVVYAFNPHSAKNVRRPANYPLRMTLCEFAGMAYGPIGYIRSLVAS